MQRPSSSSFGKTLRFQFTLGSILFFLALITYLLGWGQMRYSDTTIHPMEGYTFWHFAVTAVVATMAYVVTCYFTIQVMYSAASSKARSLSTIAWVHWGWCIIVGCWCLYFCAYNIKTWTECNDPGPKHPECRNREYPAKTIADYSFIMMTIAGGVFAFVMAIFVYMNVVTGINRISLSLSARADVEELIEAPILGHRFGRRHDVEGREKKQREHKEMRMFTSGTY